MKKHLYLYPVWYH